MIYGDNNMVPYFYRCRSGIKLILSRGRISLAIVASRRTPRENLPLFSPLRENDNRRRKNNLPFLFFFFFSSLLVAGEARYFLDIYIYI